jgi:hypothetical protein
MPSAYTSARPSIFFPRACSGGHVERRTHHRATGGLHACGLADQLGHPEIEKLRYRLAVRFPDEKDILRLEIAMDDACGMSRVQRLGDEREELNRVGHRDGRRLGDVPIERFAVEQVHDEEVSTVGQLSEREDIDDVAATNLVRGLRLGDEAHGTDGIHTLRSVEDLDGCPAPEEGVLRLVDGSVPAFAELAAEPVLSGHLTDDIGGCDDGIGRRFGHTARATIPCNSPTARWRRRCRYSAAFQPATSEISPLGSDGLRRVLARAAGWDPR